MVSGDGRYIVSLDTLNKVVVNNFPNVCNLQSVNTDQQVQIVDIEQFDGHLVHVSQEVGSAQPHANMII